MIEQERYFCERCNPENVYQKDRRETDSQPLLSNVISFSEAERRKRKDRRKRYERRNRDPIVRMPERRSSAKGRRPFDGYAWFEGCIEEALQAQWRVEEVTVSSASPSRRLLCPRCGQSKD